MTSSSQREINISVSCGFMKIFFIIDAREVFCRYSPNKNHNIAENRCTGTHSTRKCAVGVIEAKGVSNINVIN